MDESTSGEHVGDPRTYGARISFARGSAEFDSSRELDRFTDLWPKIPNHLVRIAGYSESEEGDSLGLKRAEAVHHELLRRGVAPTRFDKVAGGSNGPPWDPDMKWGDRCADVSIYNPRVCLNEYWQEFKAIQQLHLRLNIGDPEKIVRETFKAVINSEGHWTTTAIEPLQLEPGQRLLSATLLPVNFANPACLEAIVSPSGHMQDLWIRKDGVGILPLKRSFYASRIESIQMGMKIEQLYGLLGRFPPINYFSVGDRRFVQFCYRGVGTEAWHYFVEASTGMLFTFRLDMWFDRFRFPESCFWVGYKEGGPSGSGYLITPAARSI